MKILILISLLSLTLAYKRFLQISSDSINLDSTSNFEIEADESKELCISSNPTTGYEWKVVDTGYENCEVLSGKYVQSSENSDLLGAGGTQCFEFYCNQDAEAGTNYKIRMEYKRQWEEEPGEVKEVYYEIADC